MIRRLNFHITLIALILLNFNISYSQSTKDDFGKLFNRSNKKNNFSTSSCRNLLNSDKLIRLDSDEGSLTQIPSYWQGSTNMCFSVAATTLFDAYRYISNSAKSVLRVSERTSVISTAIQYSNLSLPNDKNLNGLLMNGPLGQNNTTKTLKNLLRYGGCPDRNFFDPEVIGNYFEKSYSDVIDEIKNIYMDPKLSAESKVTYIENISNTEWKQFVNDRLFKSAGNKVVLKNALAVKNNFLGVMMAFRTILCPTKERLKSSLAVNQIDTSIIEHYLNGYYTRSAPQNEFMNDVRNSIAENLTSHKSLPQILAVKVCDPENAPSQLFGFTAFDSRGKENSTSSYSHCFEHAFLVVGVRVNPWNRNTCQLLIRNSWGNRCHYGMDFADCEKENGQFWIDENRILSSTSGHIMMKNP